MTFYQRVEGAFAIAVITGDPPVAIERCEKLKRTPVKNGRNLVDNKRTVRDSNPGARKMRCEGRIQRRVVEKQFVACYHREIETSRADLTVYHLEELLSNQSAALLHGHGYVTIRVACRSEKEIDLRRSALRDLPGDLRLSEIVVRIHIDSDAGW